MFPAQNRDQLTTLQVNLGYKCNQVCKHCHVDAGPYRTEMMTEENINLIPEVIKKYGLQVLDLTGGAPELHSKFRKLIRIVKELDVHIIDRCNLTVLLEPSKAHLMDFFKENNIEIVASLPCYQEDNVNNQRGKGVFKKSIKVIQKLNSLGYGINKELKLNLVYNPQGPVLPPDQSVLESQYKTILKEKFNIIFNNFVIYISI